MHLVGFIITVKGNVHPVTCCEGMGGEGGLRYSSNL